MSIKILDCTLRDGGYYNDWDFDPQLVKNYLAVMQQSQVHYVELGLRQFRSNKYLGAHAFTTHAYLSRLDLPHGPIYGAMIDAKTVLQESSSQEECIDILFKDAREECIDLVRIAAHFKEVKYCEPMLKRLKAKGYKIGLNVMQASLRSSEELSELSCSIESWALVDVVYFADSLGSMSGKDVERVFNAIRKGWSGEMGFHAHNNMGQGVSNVKVAVELGCTWVDGTVTGMGRGAGNAETEYLLIEPELRPSNYDNSHMFGLVVKYFEGMKKKCGWGASMAYYHGATLGLHPTYVQELCTDPAFDKSQLCKVLNDLGKIDSPHAFNKTVLDTVKSKLSPNNGVVFGDNVELFLSGKSVLIVAQTQLTEDYKEAISDYVSSKKTILLSINQPRETIQLNYDLVAISHNEKYRADEEKYKHSDYNYIAPRDLFLDTAMNIKHNYGVEISEGEFKPNGNYATIPSRLTLAYAVAFCIDAGAKDIKLVGFSGYSSDDPRQKEMQFFLNLLSKLDVNIESLTPTTFSVSEASIYAL